MKSPRQCFVSMGMMKKCAKFRVGIPRRSRLRLGLHQVDVNRIGTKLDNFLSR